MKRLTKLVLALTFSNCAYGQNKPATVTQTPAPFDFSISNGTIGNIKTGELITIVLDKLQQFKVTKDSVPTCEGCDTYSPLYRVSDDNHEAIFDFEPGWDSTNKNKLFRIGVSDIRFKTDKGIRIGMTYKDLKKKYHVEEVDIGGETGVHVLVKGFNGSFGMELPQVNNWWDFNKETLPDSLKIDGIVIL